MPRAPINARRSFMVKINSQSGLHRMYDWNIVDTDLGFMVEPCQYPVVIDGKITQIDTKDMAFDSLTVTDPHTFMSIYGTGGPQLLQDYDA